MQWQPKQPPREFEVGFEAKQVLKDCGNMRLNPDEQITFVTDSGKEYDVARKTWGFYATPSVNKRLVDFGFKTALVRNRDWRYYVLVVDTDQQTAFATYCQAEQLQVIVWLSDQTSLRRLEAVVSEN